MSSVRAVLVVEIMAKLEDTGHFVFGGICVATGGMRLAIVLMLQYSAGQLFFSLPCWNVHTLVNTSCYVRMLSLCSFISRGTRNNSCGFCVKKVRDAILGFLRNFFQLKYEGVSGYNFNQAGLAL